MSASKETDWNGIDMSYSQIDNELTNDELTKVIHHYLSGLSDFERTEWLQVLTNRLAITLAKKFPLENI